MKKLFILFVVIAIAIAGYYFLIYEKESTNDVNKVTQIISTAFQDDLVMSIHSNGMIEPKQTVEVKSKASGEIIEMTIDEGDFVQKGDLICRLDTTTVMNDYLQAEADYNVARTTVNIRKREFERQKALFDKKLLSEKERDDSELLYEQAKASLVRAKSTLSSAKEKLEDTEIRSPIDGIVLRKTVEQGQIISSGVSNVSGGTLLCQVAQMDSVYVVADVDETDIGKIQLDQNVNVNPDAFPDNKFSGRVLKISPMATIEQNVTVFEVTTLIDNSESLLKAGMNCQIEVVTAEAYGAVLVPNDAVKDPVAVGFTGEMADGMQHVPGGGHGQGGKRLSREEMAERMKNMTPEQMEEMRKKFTERRKQRAGNKASKKVVMVKRDGEFAPELVTVGIANLDYTQILTGISIGDTVDATPISMMMRDREAFRERMKSRSMTGGLKKSD
jgi:HlyD family secretion protein